jgi:hypothetical protein
MSQAAPETVPFGPLELVDRVDCAAPPPAAFSDYPAGISRPATCAGRACRALPNAGGQPKYFCYRLGAGKGLVAGTAYVLAVEFPDDQPRSLFICNWGCETCRGVHTGATIGDMLKGRYVNDNPESLALPQTGKMLTWRQLFWLHDRFPALQRPRGGGPRELTPADGFPVIIAQPAADKDPLSAGAAVASIALYRVTDPAHLAQPIRYPPAGLPRRYLFSRDEMAKGVVAIGHSAAEQDPKLRGVANIVDWYEYKARQMRFLGMNAYSANLLEFGHNQGWDSSPYGGSRWYNQAPRPHLWADIVAMLQRYPELAILPYYEYAGSIGGDHTKAIGSQRRCLTLGGKKDFTFIDWCHAGNADLTDPDFVEDARRLLDCSIARIPGDPARFLGVWFRPRPEAEPISFSDADLARFSKDTSPAAPVTREALRADKALLSRYYDWWFAQRRAFLIKLRDNLRAMTRPDAVVLYTTDHTEPGLSLPASLTGKGQRDGWKWHDAVVTDDVARWQTAVPTAKDYEFVKPVAFERVVAENMHGQTLLAMHDGWGGEWQHGTPPSDPQNYRDTDGILLTYTFNRLYTVASPAAFDSFREASGLAIVRHYTLNENEFDDGKASPLGYFMADVERAGPYSMLAEARALANGDPRFLGYLTGNSFTRGFPEYARAFDAAFLSLPALPSRRLPAACADPEVVVRRIDTPKDGAWFAVINTGLSDKAAVTVDLAVGGPLEDAVNGAEIGGGRLSLTLYPGQVRTFHAVG